MDFSSVETEYRQLKAQFDAGQLTEAGFKARLQELMIEDEQDRWWMIGYETGQWYVHDGEKWVPAEPPRPAAAPPVEVRSPGLPESGQQTKEVSVEAPYTSEAGNAAPEPVGMPANKPIRPRNASRWLLAGLVAVVVLAVAIGIGLRGGGPINEQSAAVAPVATAAAVSPGATLVISQSIGLEMVRVPAGEFVMGSPEGQGSDDDEDPQHSVSLDDYWIDRTEVTNAMFARFVDETGYLTDAEKDGLGTVFDSSTQDWSEIQGANWRHPRGPESSLDGLADHPVVQVSWNDAVAYCEWAGKRLPSEAEWEKAARGTDGRTNPWGEQEPTGELSNFADRNLEVDWSDKNVDDGYQFTAPVGSYPAGASPFGALDMEGNVWEWVADWYNDGYYAQSPSENPQGPASGDYRVLRGSSWYDAASRFQAADRFRNAPFNLNDAFGFRCARSS